MKTTDRHFRGWLLASVLLTGAVTGPFAVSTVSAAENPVQGLQRQDGLFELYRDPAKGRLLQYPLWRAAA